MVRMTIFVSRLLVNSSAFAQLLSFPESCFAKAESIKGDEVCLDRRNIQKSGD